jgi:hypothetical protein
MGPEETCQTSRDIFRDQLDADWREPRHDVEQRDEAMLVDLHRSASHAAHDVEDRNFQRLFHDNAPG